MSNIRIAEISKRLTDWLDRYSPPAAMRDKPNALQAEVNAILGTVLKYAPKEGYDGWVTRMLDICAEGMRTRAWPTVGEVSKACQSVGSKTAGGGPVDEAAVEAAMTDHLADWFGKFRDQLPGRGRASRTAALIERGVLANEREARFYGFDLSDEQTKTAMGQPTGREEWRHHVGVMARLKGISFAEADAIERQMLRNPRKTAEAAAIAYTPRTFGEAAE